MLDLKACNSYKTAEDCINFNHPDLPFLLSVALTVSKLGET